MAKVKVFLSFEFDRDADLYRNFFQQAHFSFYARNGLKKDEFFVA